MKLVLFVITLVAVFGSSLQLPSQVNRILNAAEVDIKSFPHQVSIAPLGKHQCGGAIISERFVLTAAHCVKGAIKDEVVVDSFLFLLTLRIRSGTSNSESGGTVHSVLKIIPHEEYSASNKTVSSENDIALIEVREPFVFDETRQPVKLFEAGDKLNANAVGQISGFGFKEQSSKLNVVKLPVLETDTCKSTFAQSEFSIRKGQFCAAVTEGNASCYGNSGGVFLVDGRAAGIVSWYPGCGTSGSPVTITEISQYRQWIDQHTA